MRRARYRLSQFISHLLPRPLGQDEAAEVERVLGQPLMALFRRQTAGEQAHGWRVMQTLAALRGARAYTAQRELLQAALLHDVGKSQAPLNLADRTLVVLARWLAPEAAERWAHRQSTGWRGRIQRPFVTARCHPEWGAELCAAAGAPALTVHLIRRHQSPLTTPAGPEDEMLTLLQAADDDN